MGWILADGTVNPDHPFKRPEQGAATQTWAATAPQLDGSAGSTSRTATSPRPHPDAVGRSGLGSGVRDRALDPAQAARLWTLSAELTGVDAFA